MRKWNRASRCTGVEWIRIAENAVLGNPMLYRPAPIALSPPTTAAPSKAATIQAATGLPAVTSTGPIPSTAKNAAPNSRPQMPPQRGAHFSPILHAVAGVVIPDGVFLRVVLLPERIPQGVLREHDPAFCHQQAERRMSRQALRKSTRGQGNVLSRYLAGEYERGLCGKPGRRREVTARSNGGAPGIDEVTFEAIEESGGECSRADSGGVS
jgi:hypothetical protein